MLLSCLLVQVSLATFLLRPLLTDGVFVKLEGEISWPLLDVAERLVDKERGAFFV